MKKTSKNYPKNWSKTWKIGPGSHQNGHSKKNAQKHRKIKGNFEHGPQNGSPDVVICWSSGSLFLCQTALGAQIGSQASPKSPQDQSKPRFASIFGWFLPIFWWFSVSRGLLFIWFASLLFWLPRAFIFKFLATSSNVLGSSAGVSKVSKKCDVAHLLSSLPLCFCYLEPYFSSFWPYIFRGRQ